MVSVISVSIINLFLISDAKKLFSESYNANYKDIVYPDVKFYIKSQALAMTVLLDILKQHGLRLVIFPLLSTFEVVSFTTTRTLTNLFYQLIMVISQTLTPELANVVNNNKFDLYKKIIFSLNCIFILFIFPFVFVSQFFVADLYKWWTVGKLGFNLDLYRLLSCSIVLNCAYLPFFLVIQAFNFVKVQIKLSSIIALTTVVFSFWAAKIYGSVGVGYTLLLVEVITIYLIWSLFVKSELNKNIFLDFNFIKFTLVEAALFIFGSLLDSYFLIPVVVLYIAIALTYFRLNNIYLSRCTSKSNG
jgi:O-antigen/teichoic acid export membrane protein